MPGRCIGALIAHKRPFPDKRVSERAAHEERLPGVVDPGSASPTSAPEPQREARVPPQPAIIAEVPQPGHDDLIHIMGWRHSGMASNTCALMHSNLNGSRNNVFAVAFLHQTRAPSPRVGVQSKSAGSSECVRSYRVSVRTEELASCWCPLLFRVGPKKRTAAKPSSTTYSLGSFGTSPTVMP
jgi:hypothetical protein